MEAQEQGSHSLLHIQCLDHCLGTRSTLGSYLASLGEGGMDLEFAKKLLIFQLAMELNMKYASNTSDLSTNHRAPPPPQPARWSSCWYICTCQSLPGIKTIFVIRYIHCCKTGLPPSPASLWPRPVGTCIHWVRSLELQTSRSPRSSRQSQKSNSWSVLAKPSEQISFNIQA